MKKLEKYKSTLIITCIIMLIPIIIGLIIWDKLPSQMAVHFDAHNNPNNYMSKGMTIFGLTALMIVLQLVCVISTAYDNNKKGHVSDKVFGILMWILPTLDIFLFGLTYAYNLGMSVDITFWVTLLIGLMFIVLGNYLPKVQQNRFAGTRVKWTYASRKNWEHTNRFSGWVLFLLGIIFLIFSFMSLVVNFSNTAAVVFVISVCVVLTASMVLYSYLYYKKHKDDEDYYD